MMIFLCVACVGHYYYYSVLVGINREDHPLYSVQAVCPAPPCPAWPPPVQPQIEFILTIALFPIVFDSYGLLCGDSLWRTISTLTT